MIFPYLKIRNCIALMNIIKAYILKESINLQAWVETSKNSVYFKMHDIRHTHITDIHTWWQCWK